MSNFSEFLRRIRMLLRGRQFDREMEEEMRLHRELRERDARAAGADANEARYAAQRRLGNELLLRERSREAWGWSWLEHFVQDIFYGARLLRKNLGFTVVVVWECETTKLATLKRRLARLLRSGRAASRQRR